MNKLTTKAKISLVCGPIIDCKKRQLILDNSLSIISARFKRSDSSIRLFEHSGAIWVKTVVKISESLKSLEKSVAVRLLPVFFRSKLILQSRISSGERFSIFSPLFKRIVSFG